MEFNNSALSLLERCGEAFRRRYIEKEIIPPSPRMLRGTVVHAVATRGLLLKLQGEALPTVEEAKDLAATEFDATWRGGVSLSVEEISEGVQKVEGQSKDFAVDLSAFHAERVAPAMQPVAVERKITVKPKDSDLIIHGTLDLVTSSPNGEAIHDLKTSEKSPNKTAADTSQQLSFYAMLRLAEVGTIPNALILDCLVRTPVRAEKKHVVLATTRDADDVRALVNRLNVAVSAVEKGIFLPTDPSNWFCSQDWCPYWDSCPYVAKGKRRPES